ncbi:MAG: cation:proton antiporter, partial [Planctomycetes bacterium]|nr:cation:proton antiporter [Planctomycetota bacterium]
LVGGILCGAVARLLRMPTLTGYIGAGLILGHHGFDLLPHEHVDALTGPVNDVAMALVLFVLGGQFKLDTLRKSGRSLVGVSTLEGAFTFLVVTGLSFAVLDGWQGPILLGIMAIAVAPATTVVVLEEYDAQGPTTDALKLLTALSNVWAVLLFEFTLLGIVFFSGIGEVGAGAALWDIGGALCFGLLAGHALIVIQDRAGHGNYSLPLLAVLSLTIGGCKITGVPHMLAFLVTGAVVANRSRYLEPIQKSMEAFAPTAFVAFFVISGLHLDFRVLADNWIAAGMYVLARTIGKVLGARIGLHFAGLDILNPKDRSSPPLGLGLLCQAGAAIALAQVASEFNPELGHQLLNIILGAVVIFELVGPFLVKHVAVAAGEVNIGHLLVRHSEEERAPSMLASFIRAMRGRRHAKSYDLRELTVSQIMRSAHAPLSDSAGMDEILRYANRSRVNQFPVVTQEGTLVALVRLRDLEELAFDPHAASLVIASDLTSLAPDEASLTADTPVEHAAKLFGNFTGNNMAVVDDKQDWQYLGMVERADLLRILSQLEGRRATKTSS